MKVDNNIIEVEGLTHYLLENNHAQSFKKVLNSGFNFLAVHTSPFERLSCDTVVEFI